jgi:hypothetical protein
MVGSSVRVPIAGIQQQKVNDRLNARLNTPRALRRMGRDAIEG